MFLHRLFTEALKHWQWKGELSPRLFGFLLPIKPAVRNASFSDAQPVLPRSLFPERFLRRRSVYGLNAVVIL